MKDVWRLTAAGAIGIPLGVVALKLVDEELVLTFFGIFILIYAIYALLDLKLPSLEGDLWPFSIHEIC